MRRNRRNRRRTTGTSAVAVALSAVLALSACESEPSSPDGKPQAGGAGGVGVLAPGKPGEPARTLSPQEAAKAVPDDTPNDADFSYTRMMIVHHEQALRMTALVPDRAASQQVKGLAARIEAAQGPEIEAMKGWLKINGGDSGDGGDGKDGGHDHGQDAGHDHGAMPGMATEAQLKDLEGARGKAFDALFLRLMITHHEGAVTMAADVLAKGRNIRIQEMANDVIAGQTAEIHRMRGM
nr:DUF305 domain-containing protein [Streptomyces sp. TRM64462]